MEILTDFLNFMAGGPATIGLLVVAPLILLTADWRLSLSALLVQYLLVGIVLSRSVEAEVVAVKIVVGLLVMPILYLTARRIEQARGVEGSDRAERRFLGLHVGWGAGPLSLPLRFLTFLLAALAMMRLLQGYRPGLVPANLVVAACWLAVMGLIGLVLSGEPLRVAPAALTILAAFDLVYAGLQRNLAVVGLFSALTLLAALAFSYLAAVQGLGAGQSAPSGGQEPGP